MKNCKGYTLLDALTALSILTILSASVLPLYTKMYEERSVIRERKEGSILLDQFWKEFLFDKMTPPKERIVDDVTYTFDMSSSQLCVSFQGIPKRSTIICRSLPDDKE